MEEHCFLDNAKPLSKRLYNVDPFCKLRIAAHAVEESQEGDTMTIRYKEDQGRRLVVYVPRYTYYDFSYLYIYI